MTHWRRLGAQVALVGTAVAVTAAGACNPTPVRYGRGDLPAAVLDAAARCTGPLQAVLDEWFDGEAGGPDIGTTAGSAGGTEPWAMRCTWSVPGAAPITVQLSYDPEPEAVAGNVPAPLEPLGLSGVVRSTGEAGDRLLAWLDEEGVRWSVEVTAGRDELEWDWDRGLDRGEHLAATAIGGT